ncbi:MAG: hypothetical protein ACK5IJ_12205 [Mangrovibacterium sp.]
MTKQNGEIIIMSCLLISVVLLKSELLNRSLYTLIGLASSISLGVLGILNFQRRGINPFVYWASYLLFVNISACTVLVNYTKAGILEYLIPASQIAIFFWLFFLIVFTNREQLIQKFILNFILLGMVCSALMYLS